MNDQTIGELNETIRLNPEDTVAYINRGFAYYQEGDYDRAIADFDRAIQLDPEDTTAYITRGSAYAGKGNYDSAIIDYDEAIRIDPECAIAYNDRGIAYFSKGMKCHRLFRPKFSKFKRSFFFENREESDTLTLNVGVCDDTPV